MKFIKKHIKLIIFILVCLSIFLIYKNNNKNNVNYTALGDSYVSETKTNSTYNEYFKDYLEENHKLNNYINCFIEEDNSIERLYNNILINKQATVNNKTINIREALRESKFLTLSIGINDLLYQLSITDNLNIYKVNKIINDIEVSFDKLIVEIKKYYPNDIYVVGYYSNTSSEILNYAIKKLNNIYKNNKKVIYISIDELSQNSTNYKRNSKISYPNSQEYKQISEKIIAKADKKLEK